MLITYLLVKATETDKVTVQNWTSSNQFSK